MHPYEQDDQAADELSVRIYTALRDGGLDAEPLIELALLLEERDVPTPVTREVLERPTADLTAADLARLGEALLEEINFGPTFALEPSLLVPLEQALKVVERDARASGITGTFRMVVPGLGDGDGGAWVEFEGIRQGNSLGPGDGSGTQWALWCVADATQEVVMEVIWKAWPVCSTHNLGLYAELEDEIAVWRCRSGGTHTVASVGELPAERR